MCGLRYAKGLLIFGYEHCWCLLREVPCCNGLIGKWNIAKDGCPILRRVDENMLMDEERRKHYLYRKEGIIW